MNKTVKYTSEYVYNNNKLSKTCKFKENTEQEYDQKYGANYHRSVKVKCVAEFLVRRKNETKKMTTESYNNIGEVNKKMQSSEGMCIFIRIIELKYIIEGGI